MRLSLISLSLAAGFRIPAPAAGEFRLPHRAGLFDMPGYVEGGDRLFGSPLDAWACGYSAVGGKSVPWITTLTDGVSRSAGLLPGAEFEGGEVTLNWFNEGGWVHGYAGYQPEPGAPRVPVPWVADGATGRTMRAGLTGPEYSPPAEGHAASDVESLTVSGFASGRAYRRDGGKYRGDAVWVMNCHTGAVSRVGFLRGRNIRTATALSRATGETSRRADGSSGTAGGTVRGRTPGWPAPLRE